MKKRRRAINVGRKPPYSRPALTQERIIKEAIAILDREGLDGLTMRILAGRMKIKAASLYNHVRSKEEMMELIADRICAEFFLGGASRDWREFLKEAAIQFRRVLLSHRDAARILAATAPTGPHRLRLIEAILNALIQGGFSTADSTDAASVHNSFVVGFVLDETLGSDSVPRFLDCLVERDASWSKSLSSEEFPTIVALADELVATTPDRRFAFGIQALLDGFEARLLGKKQVHAASKRRIAE